MAHAISPSIPQNLGKLLAFDILTGKCVFQQLLDYPPKSLQLLPDRMTLCITVACPVTGKAMLQYYVIDNLESN